MHTKIVMLGTGTPNPVPERNGPCTAIVVGERAYLVDMGIGCVRQAEIGRRMGIHQLDAKNLDIAFVTHMHSDHTLGFSDLIFTPWVLERKNPLRVFGPKGITKMAEYLHLAYEMDIEARRYGYEQANMDGCTVEATEISEGVVYEDELVRVEAFLVNHPPFEAYGYKFITPDKTIVISGDTTNNDNLIKHAKGCDILIHEVYSSQGIKQRSPKWANYHKNVHTSSLELGELAKEVNPKKLVLYHQLFFRVKDENGFLISEVDRELEMVREISENYKGEIISAKDMMVIS